MTEYISGPAGILTFARSTVQCSSLELLSYLNSNSSVPRAAEERTHEDREEIHNYDLHVSHQWTEKTILFKTCWNKLKACERTESREICAARHAFRGCKSNLVEQHLSQNTSHVNTQNPLRSTFVRAGDEQAQTITKMFIHVTHSTHRLLFLQCRYIGLYSVIHRD